MSDVSTPAAPVRLYSQTEHDAYGNFHYAGDLHHPGEATADLARRIEAHLVRHFPRARFAVKSRSYAGGRTIEAEILDADAELTKREDQEAFMTLVRDQMQRFGVTRANICQDYHSATFCCLVKIDPAYWAALAGRGERRNPVEPRMSLAAFKRQLKPGDRLKLLHASAGSSVLGVTRTVTAVRSADIIIDGTTYMNFPRASAFACDGRYVRIATGHERDADSHRLYEWTPLQDPSAVKDAA
jgi:hypothetical protein